MEFFQYIGEIGIFYWDNWKYFLKALYLIISGKNSGKKKPALTGKMRAGGGMEGENRRLRLKVRINI